MTNGAETRARRSRNRILDAAEDVFLRHGFLGASMDAVASVAGVSKQTVYAHCKSKEALFVQVVERMTGAAARDIGADKQDRFEGISAEQFFLDAATQQLLVVMTPRLMRLRRMVIGEVERFPELGRALYENSVERTVARYTRAVKHFSSIGELYCEDHAAAANHFNWLLMGAPTNSAMFLGDAGIPSKAALKAHARESVRVFLAAFANAART